MKGQGRGRFESSDMSMSVHLNIKNKPKQFRPWPEIEGEEIDLWSIGTEEYKARQTGKIQLKFSSD